MYNWKRFFAVFGFVVFVLICFTFNSLMNFFPQLDNVEERTVSHFYKVKYDGIVIKKMGESENAIRHSIYLNEKGKRKFVDFTIEKSIFDYLVIGDSIIKMPEELSVNIYRNGMKDTTMEIVLY